MDRFDLIERISDVDSNYVLGDYDSWSTEELQELALNLGIEIINTDD